MKLGLQQNVRPDLQLRLSPQLLQRIEVLQMSWLDLANLIDQELQQNETLELDVEASDDDDDEPAETEPEEFELDDEGEWVRPASNEDRVDAVDIEPAPPMTLRESLHQQLELMELADRERRLAEVLAEAVDDRGWLTTPPDELDYGVDPPPTAAEREHAVHLLQSLDPRGVGATDMAECLLLQLDEDHEEYELVVSLILHHLDDIAHNRIPRIVRETGATVERVLAAIEVISHLDPIPGRSFGGDDVPRVRPDVVVEPEGDGYELRLENSWLPKLHVARQWTELARDRSTDKELRKHLRGKIDSARSLIDAIEQRKHTLFRVATELVNRQVDFLDKGPAALHPLRMQEVADALGIHVSTVSRAISGKYIQTPRGIVPLKAFFSGEAASRTGAGGDGDGPDASRAEVCEKVRAIIDGEDKHRPLSDEAIVKALKEREGIDIARRTVTKYRKSMGIGSSRSRRIYAPS